MLSVRHCWLRPCQHIEIIVGDFTQSVVATVSIQDHREMWQHWTNTQPPTTTINQNYTTCRPGPFKTPSLWTQYVRLGTPKYRTHVCVCLRMRIIQGRAWMILLYYKRSVMKYTVLFYIHVNSVHSQYIFHYNWNSVKLINVIVETCKQHCDVT